jgi:HEAT repeat protein
VLKASSPSYTAMPQELGRDSKQRGIQVMRIVLRIILPIILVTAASIEVLAAQAQKPLASTTAFREARDLIGNGEWEQAEVRFNRFISDFPQDREVSAALYWLAFSLKQQGKLPAADAALTRLIDRYPTSSWLNDARAMRVEIAPRLKNNQVIEQGVSDPNDEIRLTALQSLFEARPERALSMAAEILKQGSSASRPLREGAVALLGDSETMEAIPILVQVARNDPDMRLRKKAIEALAEYDGEARKALLEIARSNAEVDVRSAAIEALAEIENDPAVVDDLVALMASSREPRLQRKLIGTLGEIESSRAETALAQIARNSTSVEVRLQAIDALAEHESDSAADSLAQLYDAEKDEKVKEEIINALENTESKAGLRKLSQIAAREPSLRLRKQALSAVGDSDDPDVIKYLEEILKQERSQ